MILHIFLMNFLILLLIRIYIYNTIFVGEFNFHYGSLISHNLEFKYILNSLSLKQHFLSKTHYLGNMYDLVLTNSDIVYGIPIK